MPDIKRFCFNLFREHCTIIWKDRSKAVVIDPGMYSDKEVKEFSDFVSSEGLGIAAVLLTHAHADHIFSAKFVQDRYGAVVYMNPEDREGFEYCKELASTIGMKAPDCSFTTTDIADGDTIEAGGFSFQVITTPGHTPGSVCYYDAEDKIMFTGDTLMAGTIGRTDLTGGDYDKEIVSIMEKLMFLDGDIRIFPGHGETSTISDERTGNPFLQPFNEPEETIIEED